MPPPLPLRPPTRRLPHRLAPQGALPSVTLPRAECMPPSLVFFTPSAGTLGRVGGWWQGLLFRLLSPGAARSAPPPSRLDTVKREFRACLADIDTPQAAELRTRLGQAHSLRDLWHLRSELYAAIAVSHSQAEAETRLALLNAHFPTRAPRSQFAPL